MSTTSAQQALQQQRALLQMEYEAERRAFEQQTEAQGLARLVKRGHAWMPVRATRPHWNSLNQQCIEVHRLEDTDVEHSFEYGRSVVFFRQIAGGKVVYLPFTATVSYAETDRMVVVLPEGHTRDLEVGEGLLGVQLSFDETSHRAMIEALQRVERATTGRLAYLRDLFYSSQMPQQSTFTPVHLPWLNETQQHAVNEVLRAKDVAVVHGPPGTGKTTTLVEAIGETLMRESQVLVCAQSNMAVDWISERLVDRGVHVLRLGNPTRVNDKMLAFTYERRFEAHPDYPQLWALRRALRELRGQRGKGGSLHQKRDRLRARITELEVRIHTNLFEEARVIACTLVGAASKILDGKRFHTLFIDEAAQALEAACWIPLRRASRVVLAGDHCQLPPTIKSTEALRGGLGRTLMERLAETKPQCVTLLDTQYRMNRHIMEFSSREFYHGRVKADASVDHRSILDYDLPITWVDTAQEGLMEANLTEADFQEHFVGENFGRVNHGEAVLTLQLLQHYMERLGRQRVEQEHIDVGIISPYRAQVQHLRQLLRKHDALKPFRQRITISTVDGFQGQERDVIIISLVRANGDGEIGFLRDLRRMNVAITRARMKLIILGSVPTLTKHPFYARLWNYCEQLRKMET